MSRISRNPSIGVRVFKVPSIKKAKLKKLIAEMPLDDLAPKVIDKDAHEKFVRNIFAIRGETADRSQSGILIKDRRQRAA